MPRSFHCDDPDPNAWMTRTTWDDTPVMAESWKPLSFLINRPLARSQLWNIPAAKPIEPRSLPPAKYIPPKEKEKDPLDDLIIWKDGRRHIMLDGVLTPLTWEQHSGPQSMYPPAIPVPGVSKKPRGRTAPTKEMGVRTGTTYTCKVEGCRKVFTRSEHLKRHIRSLHTHEQNYMCALPFCDKTFTRRDNLLQHERKHKHYQAFFDCRDNFDGQLMPEYLPHLAPEEDDPPIIWNIDPLLQQPSTSSRQTISFGDDRRNLPSSTGLVDPFVPPLTSSDGLALPSLSGVMSCVPPLAGGDL